MTDLEARMKAARIVASCPKRRLPAVMEILKNSGVEISKEAIDEALGLREEKVERRKARLSEKRREAGEPETWCYVEDDCVDALRYVYMDGVSFSELERVTGIGRGTLYHYVHGNREISSKNREILFRGLASLGYGNVN